MDDYLRKLETGYIKKVPGFNGYYASMDGKIYTEKIMSLGFRQMRTHRGASGKGYMNLNMVNDAGIPRKVSVHRIVAMTFLPNPENKPEVDHIDRNILNNVLSNLRWATRRENLEQSYITMSPVRNFVKSDLYKGSDLVGEFQSITAAVRYAGVMFGVSETMLDKHREWHEYKIIKHLEV